MADVSLTAAFSTVPAGEAEEIKRVIVETVQQVAQDDGTFKRAKLVFTESDGRCGLTAELDGVKREGVPLQLDLEQLEDAKTSAGARAQLKEALRLYFRKVLGKKRRGAAPLCLAWLAVPRRGRGPAAQGGVALLLQAPRRPSRRARARDRRRARARGGPHGQGRRRGGGHRHRPRRRRPDPRERPPERRARGRAARRLLRARRGRAVRPDLHELAADAHATRARADGSRGRGRQRRRGRLGDPRPRDPGRAGPPRARRPTRLHDLRLPWPKDRVRQARGGRAHALRRRERDAGVPADRLRAPRSHPRPRHRGDGAGGSADGGRARRDPGRARRLARRDATPDRERRRLRAHARRVGRHPRRSPSRHRHEHDGARHPRRGSRLARRGARLGTRNRPPRQPDARRSAHERAVPGGRVGTLHPRRAPRGAARRGEGRRARGGGADRGVRDARETRPDAPRHASPRGPPRAGDRRRARRGEAARRSGAEPEPACACPRALGRPPDARPFLRRIGPRRLLDPRDGKGPALPTLVGLIAAVRAEAEGRGRAIAAIGVGVPGAVDPLLGRVGEPVPHVPELAGRALAAELTERFGLPVFVDNDVNALALGEWMFGAGRGAGSLVVLAPGTSFGAGIVLDGRVVRGAAGFGGELGHAPVKFDGGPCWCGGRGCLALYASGRGIAEAARARVAGLSDAPLLAAAGGDPRAITAPLVFRAAREGDPVASSGVDEACRALGAMLGTVVNGLNPEVVVITGGVAESLGPLAAQILARAGEYAFDRALAATRVTIVPSDKRTSMRGAAALAIYEIERTARSR